MGRIQLCHTATRQYSVLYRTMRYRKPSPVRVRMISWPPVRGLVTSSTCSSPSVLHGCGHRGVQVMKRATQSGGEALSPGFQPTPKSHAGLGGDGCSSCQGFSSRALLPASPLPPPSFPPSNITSSIRHVVLCCLDLL